MVVQLDNELFTDDRTILDYEKSLASGQSGLLGGVLNNRPACEVSSFHKFSTVMPLSKTLHHTIS